MFCLFLETTPLLSLGYDWYCILFPNLEQPLMYIGDYYFKHNIVAYDLSCHYLTMLYGGFFLHVFYKGLSLQ